MRVLGGVEAGEKQFFQRFGDKRVGGNKAGEKQLFRDFGNKVGKLGNNGGTGTTQLRALGRMQYFQGKSGGTHRTRQEDVVFPGE